MKSHSSSPIPHFPVRLCLLGLAVGQILLQVAASAQTLDPWETIDDFQYALGFGSGAMDIGADPNGNLFVAGFGVTDSSARLGVLRETTDPGQSPPAWSSETFTYSISQRAQNTAFAADPNPLRAGVLYVGGDLVGSTPQAWIVQRSTDDGATWTIDDFYEPPAGTDWYLRGMTVDAQGNVFACGNAVTSTVLAWVVRRRDSATGLWTTVENLGGKGLAIAHAAAADPSSGVFVVGDAPSGKQGTTWAVRRSTDGGHTWAQIDTASGHAYGIAILPRANGALSTIQVVGYASSQAGNSWIVRASTDGGTTWSTTDNFIYTAVRGQSTEAEGACFDAAGNAYVCGFGSDAANNWHWLVRKKLAGSPQWQISDDYLYPNATDTLPNSRAAFLNGNVFVTGQASDSASVGHWITRRLSVGP